MSLDIPELETTEVAKKLNIPHVKLIDIRPVEAYNGWRLENECRGGHIQSAKSLPLKWTQYIDWTDIVRSKKIDPQDELIIYGYHKDESEKVANLFLMAGYRKVGLYNKFLKEWCNQLQLPMCRMSRYRQLVSAHWLNTLINTGTAAEFNNRHYVLVHAFYRDRNVYDSGHIPGAIPLDTNTLESTESWNRRSPAELKMTLEHAGITCDTTVILYGKFAFPDFNDPFPGSSAGQLGAMRCAFIMLYAGIKDVKLLNGGMQSWIDEGFNTTTEASLPEPVSDFGNVIPVHPELAVDLSEAKQILKAKNKNLVCVRSWNEYIGETSGYNYIHKKGRIPGAVFAECGSDAYHMENYRNVDHTTREYHEIESIWAAVNITPQVHNSFYCGTGWRASEAFINAWLMGWSDISVYDGGWFEWSNDLNNPIETGIPVKPVI
ncbi:MAG TPA: rhodanese-like domain-containing protein [Chitinispirillaceae bacterium]|nr:rhodanese-like domain-containing protein [Chitinispirillaceae bacterium]